MTIVGVASMLGLCSAILCLQASAQEIENAIIGVEATASGSLVEINITLDNDSDSNSDNEHERRVRHFSTASPPCIVVDFPLSATDTLGKGNTIAFPPAIQKTILQEYTIAQGDDRTRLIFKLKHAATYAVFTSRRNVLIRIDHHQDGLDNPAAAPKLSLNFQQAEIRAVLHSFAEFTGINIVASDSVTGTVTLRLQQVPWPLALDVILQARGLAMQRRGSVIWIAPQSELLAREKSQRDEQAQSAAHEPLQTEVFQLNYQKADIFRKLFGVGKGGDSDVHPHMLSRRGSTLVDARTNQLFVTDTRATLDKVRSLLSKIDVPARQVLIEARIVEADDSFSRNLGARLGLASAFQNPAGTANAATDNRPGVDFPAASLAGLAAGRVGLSLFSAGANRLLNLELSALESEGRGQIISSPRVITADQQAALIEQGEEIPYQQSTSSGATSVAFKKANLKLEVTPQITPDGHVILSVDISKDSRGIATPGGLAINTKHVKTQVQVEDGGTVIIGGIYTRTESDANNKVPLLGDLPLLGHLFKNTAKAASKTELLIFLTPSIVASDDLRQ